MTTAKFSFKVLTHKKPEVEHTKTNAKFSNALDEIDENDKKKKIFSIENGVIQGEKSETKEKKTYIIPIEKGNDWRIEKLKAKVKDGNATEEEIARLAIMLELFCENSSDTKDNKTIDNDLSKKSDDFINGSSITADYDAIPVEEFGLAFLRGCGWKKEEGIGKTNKSVVSLRVSEPRPKGLGLGCEILNKIPTKKNGNSKQNNEILSTIKLKSKVEITSGKYRNLVGILQSIDEDNSSCFVELEEDNKNTNLHNNGIVRASIFSIRIFDEKKNTANANFDVDIKPECSTNSSKLEFTPQKKKEKHDDSNRYVEKSKSDNKYKYDNKIYDRKESNYKKDERYKKSSNYEREIRHKLHSDKKKLKVEKGNERRKNYDNKK